MNLSIMLQKSTMKLDNYTAKQKCKQNWNTHQVTRFICIIYLLLYFLNITLRNFIRHGIGYCLINCHMICFFCCNLVAFMKRPMTKTQDKGVIIVLYQPKWSFFFLFIYWPTYDNDTWQRHMKKTFIDKEINTKIEDTLTSSRTWPSGIKVLLCDVLEEGEGWNDHMTFAHSGDDLLLVVQDLKLDVDVGLWCVDLQAGEVVLCHFHWLSVCHT